MSSNRFPFLIDVAADCLFVDVVIDRDYDQTRAYDLHNTVHLCLISDYRCGEIGLVDARSSLVYLAYDARRDVST